MRLLSAFVVCSSLAFSADLPSAEDLLAKSLQQSGGKSYAEAKSVVLTGTVELQGHNIRGPVAITQKDGKSYTSIYLPGIGKVEEGSDGNTAWEMNALQGARIKEGEEKAAVERSERLNILSTWRDYYTSARTVGSEDVNGKPTWKVELTPKTGKPEFFYLDQKTLLLARMAQTVATALGEISVDSTVSDYRLVDGIQTPFRMTQNAMGQVMEMHFDSVRYNVPISDERFALPADVKAILEKRKAQQ